MMGDVGIISGHGWVTPKPNGLKAKCGGPALCSACRLEAWRKREMDTEKLLKASGYSQKREVSQAVPGDIPKWNDDSEIAVREMVSFLGASAVFAIVQNWILETTSK